MTPPEPTARLLDRESLRQQALACAQAQAAPLARRRLRARQWRWALGRGLLWAGTPALLVAATWAWRSGWLAPWLGAH
ncbi:hypothetical protein [Ideonella oryzae]|uniref:Uncharacterized protein n=1 Tax=Ideonella oryzae TaxID=2937441 RepID=A0ABT1BJT7_9BURK|nr:hypothetical protein [Ideonella oryzae]MCO5975877.1 hypothetical protein [Ideonella oryzae]